MLNIGMTELLIFGIIVLLVLGPEKLPEAVRFVGKWYGKAKRTVNNIQNDFDRELRLSELREQMLAEMERIQALEAKMQAQMAELEKPIEFEQPPLSTPKTAMPVSYQPVQATRSSVYLPQPQKVYTTKMDTHYSKLEVAV